jgi:HlyD family secretion protein
MDIARPDLALRKRRTRLIAGGATVIALVVGLIGVSRLEPAVPTVDGSTLWSDTVKRGELVREVRGTGTLVPEDIRWIAAVTDGRVERVLVHPGASVTADTVILELANEELVLQALEAESQHRAAAAQLAEAKARIEGALLDQKATAERVASEARQAKMRAEAEAELSTQGLVASLTANLSKASAEELAQRSGIEVERLRLATGSVDAQIAVARAAVEQRRAVADLRRSQLDALRVRAGIAGVLQSVPVEVGQRVSPGTNLARVAEPSRLKAVVRVPETLAKDVRIGLLARVDTRNGVVNGRVSRIDPAATAGTVAVDVTFDGSLPAGARPDLTVDGTIEIERLPNVLHVGRPAQANEQAALSLFRLSADGRTASRTRVQLGRASVNAVEIRDGLAEGDRVVLSDTSAWDGLDRLRLK